MKYLLMIGLGLLMSGCAWEAKVLAPDCIKISPTMAWELQKGINTKQKPSVTACAEWKIKK